jgi:hypothetical protein
MSVWTVWIPDYGLEALVKLMTACVSVVTAILLWPLLPRIIALPSHDQLRSANEALIGTAKNLEHLAHHDVLTGLGGAKGEWRIRGATDWPRPANMMSALVVSAL